MVAEAENCAREVLLSQGCSNGAVMKRADMNTWLVVEPPIRKI
jgi:hypothetical protein